MVWWNGRCRRASVASQAFGSDRNDGERKEGKNKKIFVNIDVDRGRFPCIAEVPLTDQMLNLNG